MPRGELKTAFSRQGLFVMSSLVVPVTLERTGSAPAPAT